METEQKGGQPQEWAIQPELAESGQEDEAVNHEYEAIITDRPPVDGGQEGLIFKLSVDEMVESTEVMKRSGIPVEGDSAIKVLKVFSPGRIEKEYRAHERAYRILEEARAAGTHDIARAPRPIDFRKIHISEQTREILNREGSDIKGSQAEVMMMDFVNGHDLQHIFYSWVVKHAPDSKKYAVDFDEDNASYANLHRAVSGILEFGHLPPPGTPEADMEIDSRRQKVISFLQRTGFTLDKSVVDQIRNTRRLLQSNALFHNDEHERNFMLEGDQVYIIDFARASDRPLEGDVDFAIDELLEKLTVEYRMKQESDRRESALGGVRQAADSASLEARFRAVYEAADKGPLELGRALAVRSMAATSGEQPAEEFAGLLLRLVEGGRLDRPAAISVLDHMRDSMRTPQYKRGKVEGFQIRNPAVFNRLEKYKSLFA